jgi:hypothetical protein
MRKNNYNTGFEENLKFFHGKSRIVNNIEPRRAKELCTIHKSEIVALIFVAIADIVDNSDQSITSLIN